MAGPALYHRDKLPQASHQVKPQLHFAALVPQHKFLLQSISACSCAIVQEQRCLSLRLPTHVMRFMASGTSVPTSPKSSEHMQWKIIWAQYKPQQQWALPMNHDIGSAVLTCCTVCYWLASLPAKRPRFTTSLQTELFRDLSEGQSSVGQLSLLSAGATLLWQPDGTQQEKQTERTLTLQPPGGRMGSSGPQPLWLQWQNYFILWKMHIRAICTTGIMPQSLLLPPAIPFTSSLAI